MGTSDPKVAKSKWILCSLSLKEWGDYPVSPKTSKNWSKKRPMIWMTPRFLLSGRPSPNQPARKRTGGPGMVVLSKTNKVNGPMGFKSGHCPWQLKSATGFDFCLIESYRRNLCFPRTEKRVSSPSRCQNWGKKTVNHQKQEILKIIQCI